MAKYERMVVQASRTQEVAASTQAQFTPPTSGIHIQATGTITVRFADDEVDVGLEVVEGQVYPYSIKSCPSSNAVGFVALF